MASIINASSTGSGGLISTADASGQLELQANGSTKLTVTSSGVSITGGIASPLAVTGNSTAGAEIRLPEDTDNGSNYVALKAANSIASNVTFTLPSADGTNGQVLQTNGSGTLSFATPSSGALVFLSTVTASNSATVDIETTFDSTYDAYVIVATDVVPQNNGSFLYCRMKIGGSYLTTNTYYSFAQNGVATSTTNDNKAVNGLDSIRNILNDQSNSASSNGVFNINIYQPSSTTKQHVFSWIGGCVARLGALGFTSGSGKNDTTGALTGIRLFYDSGNVSTGTFRLYGIKNS